LRIELIDGIEVSSAPELNNLGLLLYRKPTLSTEVDKWPRSQKKVIVELIDTGTDKRYVRRDEKGRVEDVADVGRSLARDRQQQAKTKVPPGQGDRGDQKRK
jgi:hypothetical protein